MACKNNNNKVKLTINYFIRNIYSEYRIVNITSNYFEKLSNISNFWELNNIMLFFYYF